MEFLLLLYIPEYMQISFQNSGGNTECIVVTEPERFHKGGEKAPVGRE